MTPKYPEPLGLLLLRAARGAERAFDRQMPGGSSRWRILRTLVSGRVETQTALADAVALRAATLVHHLDALEAEGLVSRVRNPENRRSQRVHLTDAGRARYDEMLATVLAYDEALRCAVGAEAEPALRAALMRIAAAFDDAG